MPPLDFLGLTARQFCRDYWQKKPLLVRDAFPGFTGLLSPDELAGLACEESAQSRLVRRRGGRYSLENGPFDEATFAALPDKNWTLLVQGVNHFEPAAERLLQRFSFIPHARLDDLMVSYAPPGGGVGPHFDSYDVFLIQGQGHRRWEISSQRDMDLVPDAPLRILSDFRPEQSWDLGPGDLLYLPPRYAHHGVALDECMTYSVGFRAPSAPELAAQFLSFLPDHLCAQGMYEDPDITPASARPAEIDDRMIGKVEALLEQVRWDRSLVERFVGQYFSEPKPHIVFDRPARPLKLPAFARRVAARGLRLSLTSLMLSRGRTFFLNGEPLSVSAAEARALRPLADQRRLPSGASLPESLLPRLHAWYLYGWVQVGEEG